MPRSKKAKAKNSRKQLKNQTVYAFIDSQNLNLGVSRNVYRKRKKIYTGWKLDFKKFRIYLSEKYNVRRAYLFLGYIPKNKKLYDYLRSSGYELVFKPAVKYYWQKTEKTKGNVDAELVVWTMKSVYENRCDKAIIVSGDGVFAVLAEFLLKTWKLKKFIVPNKYTMSVLIKGVFVKKGKLDLLTWLNNEKGKLIKINH